MLVSVIMPVYNMEKYLDKAIKSVVNQTYSDVEIIIVDDGSTDKSLELIKKINDCEKKIIVIEKENGGIGSAIEAGVKIASGTYITFLDADDYYDERLIQNAMEIAVQHNIEVINYPKRYWNESGELVSATDYCQMNIFGNSEVINYQSKIIKNPSMCRLYRKELIKEVDFIHTSFGIDEIVNILVLKKCVSMSSVEKCYYNVLIRNESVSRSNVSKNIENYMFVYDEMFRITNGNNELLKMVYCKYIDLLTALLIGLQKAKSPKKDIHNFLNSSIKLIKDNSQKRMNLPAMTRFKKLYIRIISAL